MKYTLLRKKIEKKEDGMLKIAEAIGVTEKILSRKLKGEIPLMADEVFLIAKALNIVALKDRLAFFYPKRPKSGTKRREEEFNT